ncbi:MAG: hypothetical protein IT581_06480 [Verrucomicrobiales bacterium]|nr:hypothetical protein [Verrucomicrobiales bacterium]
MKPSSKTASAVGKFHTSKQSDSQRLQQARWRRYVERHREDINRRRRDRRRLVKSFVPYGQATLIEVAIHTGIGLCDVVTTQTDAIAKVRELLLLSTEEIYKPQIERWTQVARVLFEEGLHLEATEIMVLVRDFEKLLWKESTGAYLQEFAPTDVFGPADPNDAEEEGTPFGGVEPSDDGLE